MTMTNRLFTIAVIVAALFIGLPANAQLVTLTSTTTSAAMSATDTFVCLTSATGVNVPGVGTLGSLLFVGREPMVVQSVTATSTCFNVTRPNRAVGHASGETVYLGDRAKFYNYTPDGTCTVGSLDVRPWINIQDGVVSDCVSSHWTRINTGPTAAWCGTTNTCSATDKTVGVHMVAGITAALDAASPSVATVTGISPAFTSTTSYACTGSVESASASTVALATTNISGSSFKFVGPNGGTSVIHYVCIGY